MSERPAEIIDAKCVICEKPFAARPYWKDQTSGKWKRQPRARLTCSDPCANKLRHDARRDKGQLARDPGDYAASRAKILAAHRETDLAEKARKLADTPQERAVLYGLLIWHEQFVADRRTARCTC